MAAKGENYLLSRASRLDEVCVEACAAVLPAPAAEHERQGKCLGNCFRRLVQGFEHMKKYEKTTALGRN